MKKLFNVIERYLLKKELKKSKNAIKFLENSKVEMDSRKVREGDIFFAINNGNSYIAEVLEKNPSLIFADKRAENINDERVVYVEDSIKTMQDLAHAYAQEIDTHIIGITGSNGKTTTKDILYSILSERYRVEKTKGNYNNHIGLPFTILTAHENLDFLILEMGMSDLGEIELLCDIARPEYGIITNIGFSHMETLKTQENVFKAKTEMLEYIDTSKVFVSGDDKYLKTTEAIKVGYDSENSDWILADFHEVKDGIEFSIKKDEKEWESFKSSLNGKYNSINLGIAIALAEKIGLKHDEIQRGIDEIKLTDMRFQKVHWCGLEVINDAYNASPLSMEVGIETFATIYRDRKKIAVLGDMLELGDEEILYHKEIIKKAYETEIEKILLFGPRMKSGLELFKKEREGMSRIKEVEYFETKDQIKVYLTKFLDSDAVLYLKGSRGMRLEEILK